MASLKGVATAADYSELRALGYIVGTWFLLSILGSMVMGAGAAGSLFPLVAICVIAWTPARRASPRGRGAPARREPLKAAKSPTRPAGLFASFRSDGHRVSFLLLTAKAPFVRSA